MTEVAHSLVYNSFEIVADWWNYKNIISPFNRIYLITDGEGWVYMDDKKYHLTPGMLFLIPKYTFHSYRCDHSMGHFYVCYFDEGVFCNGFTDGLTFNYLVNSNINDRCLFERINELNPEGRIKNPDPAVYDNNKALHSISTSRNLLPLKHLIEIQGIIFQLASRFICEKEVFSPSITSLKRFSKLTKFIQQNLGSKITLPDLAKSVCLSPDYLSKHFLEIVGVRPMEYVSRVRMERAQMLLVTTDLPIKQIAEIVGIGTNSYFSTLFKKHTLLSPEEYRKIHNAM